eukprot:TRINITY_DN13753_c0_g1_i1.p1 TRINITY_DN13753_c0_g1~~TRINITY_DN13753_c0_g1_i1.p1  ORF type:complete len:702 (+),score=110.47 TRINITY_DN13753_c0_g1_i1:38-2143(+)
MAAGEPGTAGAVTICTSCVGADAFISDIEELWALVPGLGTPNLGGCLNMCSEGPNCTVGGRLVQRNRNFDKSLDIFRECSGGLDLAIPEEVLNRVRLKSDAMRQMACGPNQNIIAAEELLSDAIRLEMDSQNVASGLVQVPSSLRLIELRFLRAEARASSALGKFEGALQDLDDVLAEVPNSARAHLEKAKILRRAKRPADAMNYFAKALEAGENAREGSSTKDRLCSPYLSKQQRTWVTRNIESLQDIVALGDQSGGCADATDSGDGSGQWKVVEIVGVSFDTCLYRLENSPPAVPHPYHRHAWHVSVRFGASSRDYTPLSSAEDWEQGRLDLLVKTYVDGEVSKKFATLQPFSVSQGACWATVTVPKLTLTFPSLVESPQSQKQQRIEATTSVRHVGLVVGGTGVVPALQILREIAQGEQGAFGRDCKGTLICASRRACDILALAELRAVEASGAGRVVVWHTLTDHSDDPTARDRAAQEASSAFASGLSSLPCRHRFFASFWRPPTKRIKPLQTGLGEEAGLRGRPTPTMLRALLPPPAEGVRVVVCGPPKMWDDVKEMLLGLGHAQENLTELKALSAEQLMDGIVAEPSLKKPFAKSVDTSNAADVAEIDNRIRAAQVIAEDDDALRQKAVDAGNVSEPSGSLEDASPQASNRVDQVAKDSKQQSSEGSWSWWQTSWSSSGDRWSSGDWKTSKWGHT